MRYTDKQLAEKKELIKKAIGLRDKLFRKIAPQREYMCYFIQYYPNWNTPIGKSKIRQTMNGHLANTDVIKMIEYIMEQL